MQREERLLGGLQRDCFQVDCIGISGRRIKDMNVTVTLDPGEISGFEGLSR